MCDRFDGYPEEEYTPPDPGPDFMGIYKAHLEELCGHIANDWDPPKEEQHE